MGLSPLTFTGISQYSQDFQTILQRVTTIASFPLNQLKNEQADIGTKRQLTSELSNSVKLLGDKIKTLRDVAGNRAVSATSSNTSKLTIDSVNTDTLTTYNITDVSSTAKAASETSSASYADSTATQVSTTGNVRLTVGSSTYNISLAGGKNNLVGLRDKINTLGAGVTATILTVDGTTNYLSVTANTAGAKTLSLKDDPDGANTNLLTSTNQGSNLNFKLNGVPVSRTSNQVNDLIPGVTFSLKSTTAADETLSIGLSSDRSKLSGAISGFIDAYNAVQDKVGAQVGKSAGLLSGDYLVREAQDILRKTSSFSIAEGSVKNYSDIGITFAANGAVSFDFTQFNSLNETKLRDSFAFFKDTTGLGSLAEATDGFSEDVTGLAQIQVAQYDKTDDRLNQQISKLEERINLIRESYLQKLQAADSLLGRFDTQKNIIGASVDSLNLVLYGKRDG
ncbi:MAG: flagellar filament capping protein FliD [Acidobacteria bacterium]|nr:flagellar filament capping protein FliD [Acidobacteriota bacterium]